MVRNYMIYNVLSTVVLSCRYFRSVAYRQYIQLVYGHIGKRRIPLPSRAYYAIRSKFGGKDFQGFDDDESS